MYGWSLCGSPHRRLSQQCRPPGPADRGRQKNPLGREPRAGCISSKSRRQIGARVISGFPSGLERPDETLDAVAPDDPRVLPRGAMFCALANVTRIRHRLHRLSLVLFAQRHPHPARATGGGRCLRDRRQPASGVSRLLPAHRMIPPRRDFLNENHLHQSPGFAGATCATSTTPNTGNVPTCRPFAPR